VKEFESFFGELISTVVLVDASSIPVNMLKFFRNELDLLAFVVGIVKKELIACFNASLRKNSNSMITVDLRIIYLWM
jgi:hypothetical protein